MVKDIFVWSARLFFQMVFWVFVLSINWNGQTFYDRAYGIFVDNDIVYAIDQQAAKLWSKVKQTAELTFSDTKDKNTENY